MKTILALIILFNLSGYVFSQTFNYNRITYLSDTISEVSGLLYLNGKVIAHNDSGGENVLYEVNANTGVIERKVTINNATNVDWEDICADNEFIYIADIGNNTAGNRQDLTIYRIRLSDFQNVANTSVDAEAIPFKYQDQIDFSPQPSDATDFDAEAIIAYNDSLYIFTKNWLSYTSNVYSLPKTPSTSTYESQRIDSFVANGLVTGADYNSQTHDVTLCAYNLSGGILNSFAFTIKINNFVNNHFSGGDIESREFSFPFLESPQVEGICFVDGTHLLFSAEKVTNIFTLQNWMGSLEWDGYGYPVHLKNDILIHPNPVTNVLYYNGISIANVAIYGAKGQLLLQSKENPVDISQLESGLLIVLFLDLNGQVLSSKHIIKK